MKVAYRTHLVTILCGLQVFLCAVVFLGIAGYYLLVHGSGKTANASPDLPLAFEKLGLAYKSHQYLGNGTRSADSPEYAVVTLKDGRKIIVHAHEDAVFFDGGFSAQTGEDVFSSLAEAQGAMQPGLVLEMLQKSQMNGTGEAKPVPKASLAVIPPLTEQNFREILASPGQQLFLDKPHDENSTLVVFTWDACPSCTKICNYFDSHKERITFQVLFIPVVGSRQLEASALDYLGLSTADSAAQSKALAQLARASDILGSRTGKILVPAFAWKDAQGQPHVGNLGAAQWREVTTRLNKGNALP